MSNSSDKEKVISGLTWKLAERMFSQGMTFVLSIILARLLMPSQYGIVAMINIFIVIANVFVTAGFSSSLIQKKDADDLDFSTIFYCTLTMAILMYGILFVCAPFIADFFHNEELIPLTRVSSLSMIIGALAMVQQTRLTKRIDFKSQTKITITASVCSGIVGIIMALIGFGVWALVAQTLTSQMIRTSLLWKVNKWIPSLHFSSKSFHELFGYGWKMMASNILDTVWKELYQVVVGRFYSPATLGQYTRAKQFSFLLSHNLTTVIQRVTYPVLSTIQDDKERMLRAYRKMIKTTMFITAISMFFLGAISEPLLYCLIGPKWHEAATYLPLICISGSLYPLHAINLNMLQVQGRSDLFLGLEIIKKTIALGPLFIGAFIGIMPMLYTNMLTSIIAYFLNSYYSGRMIGYSTWMQIKDIAPSYGIAVIISLSVYFLKYLPITYWVILPLQILLGILVFFFISYVTKREEYADIKGVLAPILGKFTKKK